MRVGCGWGVGVCMGGGGGVQEGLLPEIFICSVMFLGISINTSLL